MSLLITSLENAPKVQSGLDAHKMHTSQALDIVHLHLNAGDCIPLHVNDIDVVFCILEGCVHLLLSAEAAELKKFDVVEIPAGIERGLNNTSGTDARVLVIKKLK
jgi:quercetin dioxygenase-like cupin family protein